MAIVNELTYREDDRFFPIPEAKKDLPAVWAKHLIDIPTNPEGINILKGLCFDREGNLFICNTPQSRIWKLNPKTLELRVFADLPEHMMPSAVKIHKDGRIFVIVAGSDEGCLVAVLSPQGELLDKIVTGTGRIIDDMVFDADGGFYFTDLGGTFANKSACVSYVEPDYRTIHPVIAGGMIARRVHVRESSAQVLSTKHVLCVRYKKISGIIIRLGRRRCSRSRRCLSGAHGPRLQPTQASNTRCHAGRAVRAPWT